MHLLTRKDGGGGSNAHPRDDRVTFVEDTHTYLVDGKAYPYSVTGIIKLVETDKFDAARVAARTAAAKTANPRYVKPDGTRMTAAEILAAWRTANELGTDLHGRIERYLGGDESVVDGMPAANTKAFAQFQSWWKAAQADGWRVHRTEWVIFDDKARVAGSIDCVLKRAAHEYRIVDWKRCLTDSDSFATPYGGRTFAYPLSDYPECKLAEWRLQVNVYREILEAYYGVDVKSMAMVVLHPDNAAAQVFEHTRTPVARTLLNWVADGCPPQPPAPDTHPDDGADVLALLQHIASRK
jgi:hypothetical protein